MVDSDLPLWFLTRTMRMARLDGGCRFLTVRRQGIVLPPEILMLPRQKNENPPGGNMMNL